ncbi:glycoside hydrolase family 28 protein [Bradyrhizobium sp. DOA9]|uniref:glycoside hydrolase family 28 protein n=1 Tax=Bradyrhizobium sp. DOA9 TaxID=1126627 RepID=UPI00046AF91B|nr:glycosyl hydrolase family 28 protein [Bradyrhizobium sp. DOA9]
MTSGTTLWLARGATLAAVTDPQAYQKSSGRCGHITRTGDGCRPLINFLNTQGGGLYGEGTIDGQGGALMEGTTETWWQLARRAQREGARQNVPRLIQMDHAHDIAVHGITLRNAANFHIAMNYVKRATIWAVIIDTPPDARNTDGIDPGASEDVTIIHSSIRTGDDNIAIKAGTNGPTRYISILDNQFGWGHGMSIGSEVNSGVSDVTVSGLTLDGTTFGLRIKSDSSRGGLVERVTYENVCMRDNKWPIHLDTHYDPSAHGANVPVYQQIVFKHVYGTDGALVMRGFDRHHPLDISMEDVHFSRRASWQVENTNVTSVNVLPSLPGGVATAFSTASNACAATFRPFPESGSSKHGESTVWPAAPVGR